MGLEQLEARDVPAITQVPIVQWQSVGPSPTINAQLTGVDVGTAVPNPAVGAVEEIAPHPTDPAIVFVASPNGGVWRTTDATAARPTYVPLTDAAPALSVASLSLNPDNPNQLLAGLGHQSAFANVGGDPVGALYTEDALARVPTVRTLGGVLANRDILAVVARTGYLLAGGTADPRVAGDAGGLFRSLDNGATFTNLVFTGTGATPAGRLPKTAGTVLFLQADPADAARVYVMTATGLYRTDNILAATPTFVNISSPVHKFGLPTPTAANPVTTVNGKLAIHNSAAGNVIYASVVNDSVLDSVSYSTDRGATWTAMDLPSELGAGRRITAATLATPIVITTATAHGFQTGDRVLVAGVKGNLGANGVWSVTVSAPNTFSLDGSSGTGIYTGGGTVAAANGANPGGQGFIHSSLAADPVDPNVVYIGGDQQSQYRGNRGVLPGNNDFLPSPQYTRLGAVAGYADPEPDVSNKSGPYSDSRVLAVAADGTLWEGDDGGVYRRPTPRADGVSWTSAIGNLSLGQFTSLNYDSRNGGFFGGTQDTGSPNQTTLNSVPGVWQNLLLGDGGTSAIDATSSATVSYRYLFQNVTAGSTRVAVDATGAVVSSSPVQFAAPGKTARLSGLDNLDTGFTVGTAKIVLNAIDPRLGLFANTYLYEDNDPAGLALDTVARIPLPGQDARITALTYGGRLNGTGYTRVAYVGTAGGALYARGLSDGFVARTVPGAATDGGITAIVVDPDDFRRVTVVRSTDRRISGAGPFVTHVYASTDAGQTFADITANLIATNVGTAAAPAYNFDAAGFPVGGLSTDIVALAVVDPAPGGTTGGGTLLFAAGRGGVYKFTPAVAATATTPAVPARWAKFGVGLPNGLAFNLSVSGTQLAVGTQGRGAWVFADVTGNITNAVTTVTGDAAANAMGVTVDPADPTGLVVTDGLGNTARLSRAVPNVINFVGGDGADTVTIGGGAADDLTFVNAAINVDLGNNPGDRLIVRGPARSVPVGVTLDAGGLGVAGDSLFNASGAGRINVAGLGNGELDLDLGAGTGGAVVDVRGTSAARTVVTGTAGADTVAVSSSAAGGVTGAGNLAAVNGSLAFDGRSGADSLFVSDAGAAAGNADVVIGAGTVTGLAGAGDAGVIQFSNLANLTVTGSASPTLAEAFRVAAPAASTTLITNGGPSTVTVTGTRPTRGLAVYGGAGVDDIRLVGAGGGLADIRGPVLVDAGGGLNRLLLDDSARPTGGAYTVSATQVAGGTAVPVTYRATGGRYATDGGDGVVVRGSATGDDVFNVTATLAGSQTAVEGQGGNDGFFAAGEGLAGDVRLRGGAGADTFTLDGGVSGNRADTLLVSGGGGADRAVVLGSPADDPAEVTPTFVATAAGGTLTGVGSPVSVDTLANLDYDGRTGANSFAYADGTGVANGSAADPAAGIVVRPKTATGAEIRLAGGSLGPVVNVMNITGADATGLTINGDGAGAGTADAVTVLGVSDTGRGAAGAFAGTTADSGSDGIFVTDRVVVVSNTTLGTLRAVGFAFTAGGRPTVTTVAVDAGDEAGVGDTVTVVPSAAVNLVIDGGLPSKPKNGDKLIVQTSEPRSVSRGVGGVRLSTPSGAGVTYRNFENNPAGLSVTAVGADAGGGPRVRVTDAVTKAVLFDQFVFEPSFTGGVRVATGDVTGDGVPDLVVAAGYGGGPRVEVFDGATFALIANFFAYETGFRGGSFVAVGDLNGDGTGEIITGAGLGGGPLVKTFDVTGKPGRSFFAYDSAFRGGVRVAAGDVNGDGLADIVTGAGPGGGPHVRVFGGLDNAVLTQFQAFGPDYTGGVYVAAGDVDGDGYADIISGPGANGSDLIAYRSSGDGGGKIQLVPIPTEVADPAPAVSADAAREGGGIRVAVAFPDPANPVGQILTARGPGYAPRVRVLGGDLVADEGTLAFEEAFVGGVYIG